MELYEDSPSSSEHSTGSTVLPHSAAENLEHSLHQDNGTEQKSIQIEDQKGVGGCDQVVISSVTLDQGKIIKSSDKKYRYFKN
jgi:myb proto-oncogene protein